MKSILALLLTIGVAAAFAETVGSHGAAVQLPNSSDWTFAGRTEIPEEGIEIWTARNVARRESIQFCVSSSGVKVATSLDAWERGLLADGRKVKTLARNVELAGRKGRYVVARWKGRDVPVFHFIAVGDEKHLVFFSIVSSSDREFGGADSAECVRSLRIEKK